MNVVYKDFKIFVLKDLYQLVKDDLVNQALSGMETGADLESIGEQLRSSADVIWQHWCIDAQQLTFEESRKQAAQWAAKWAAAWCTSPLPKARQQILAWAVRAKVAATGCSVDEARSLYMKEFHK